MKVAGNRYHLLRSQLVGQWIFSQTVYQADTSKSTLMVCLSSQGGGIGWPSCSTVVASLHSVTDGLGL